MIKRNAQLVLALAITAALCTGGNIAQAATVSNNLLVRKTEGVEKKHKSVLYSILEDKLGYSKEEIASAAKDGKTAFDLAKQKGVTADQLKSMLIVAKSQNIDKKVKEGKITMDKGNEIKTKIEARVQKWDGNLNYNKKKKINN
jgi:Protein of unknown function (DUF2680).